MKILRLCVMAVILSSLLLVACGGGRGSGSSGPREVWQPSWYGMQGSADYVFTYGSSHGRANGNTAEISATTNAWAEAARHVEIHVQTMTKDFISEAGIDNPQVLALTEQVTRTTANQRFSGGHVTQRQVVHEDNNRFGAFIQLAIPKADINRDFMDRVKNEEALYNQFRASQSFAEMDRLLGN